MIFLKQSTASQSVLLGPFVDDTDGATAETALTIANTDIRLSANGGNMFSKTSGGGTHDEAGWYAATFDATDTATVGRLQVSVKVAGALHIFAEFQVLEEVVYDAMFGSGAALNVGTAASVTGAVGSVVGHTPQTADHTAAIAAIPTTPMRGTDSAATAASLATAQLDLDTITGSDGALLDSATTDVYHADIEYNFDSPNDEYTVRWFKNGGRITSGITVPTVQVVNRSDGTDLVPAAAMSQIGTTGAYKYDETTNVIVADEIYEIVMVATIDAGSRTWSCHAMKAS